MEERHAYVELRYNPYQQQRIVIDVLPQFSFHGIHQFELLSVYHNGLHAEHSGVSFDKDGIRGQTFTPQVTTCPSGISYTWFSMDSSYATVNSTTGEITAVAPGTTYIVANGGANGSGTCVVTVLAGSLSLNYTNNSIYTNDTFTLIATTTPSNANVTFSVTQGNNNVAITPNGNACEVRGLLAGNATITATTPQGVAYCYVNVTLAGVTLSEYSKTLIIDDSFQLYASTIPVGDTIDFTVSQNGNIVSLSGMGSSVGVTGLSEGTATVTATTSRGATASCTVTVEPMLIIAQSDIAININDFTSLEAKCYPAPNLTHPLIWEITSGSNHITIDPNVEECVINPLSLGSATITVTYRGAIRTINVEIVDTISSGIYLIGTASYEYDLSSIECSEEQPYVQLDEVYAPSYANSGIGLELSGFDAGDNQYWNIVYDGAGYYKILSVKSGMALTVPSQNLYSTNAQIVQQPYTGLDSQKWSIIEIYDHVYKIKAKTADAFNTYDLALAYDSQNNTVIQTQYTEFAPTCEWLLYLADRNNLTLLSLADDNNTSVFVGYMGDIIRYFSDAGNCGFKHYLFDNMTANECLKIIQKAQYFVYVGHGDYNNDDTYLYLDKYLIEDSNYKLYSSQIFNHVTHIDLSNMQLIFFDACSTAFPQSGNNLPLAAINAGAAYAIGFNDIIFVNEANPWLRNFFKFYLIAGQSVNDAAYNATDSIHTTMAGKYVVYTNDN